MVCRRPVQYGTAATHPQTTTIQPQNLRSAMSTPSNPYLPLLPIATTATTVTSSKARTPTIIGLYGVSGCGKSYLSMQLQRHFDEKPFSFYEGSEQVLETSGSKDLEAFKGLPKDGKERVRADTIQRISHECVNASKAGIVTGHFSFCHVPTVPVPAVRRMMIILRW